MGFCAVAILLLGASGSAQTRLEADARIGEILLCVGQGAVIDVSGRGTPGVSILDATKKLPNRIGGVALTIDDKPRSGFGSWGSALWRTGLYLTDLETTGSLGLQYQLRIARYRVSTTTSIENDRVAKTLEARWSEWIPKPPLLARIAQRRGRPTAWEVPVQVRFVLDAQQCDDRTTLVGTITGEADTSVFQCGLIHRIAEHQARATLGAELPRALSTVRAQGTAWYQAGAHDLEPTLSRISAGLQAIKVLRR